MSLQVTSNSSEFHVLEKYLFLQQEGASIPSNEMLHISSTAPVGLSYYDGTPAQINQKNNFPDPQFWVQALQPDSADESGSYQLRYSFDHPQDGFTLPGTNIEFPFSYSGNNRPQMLFDGPNKQRKLVHAQVDKYKEQSIIYCMPAENKEIETGHLETHVKSRHSEGFYTKTEVKNFEIKKTEGIITALSLLDDDKIAYCLAQRENFSAGSGSPIYSYQLCIESLVKDRESLVSRVVDTSLKKIVSTKTDKYFCLSDSGDLYLFNHADGSYELQQSELKFVDIAIDPTSKDIAFLDTQRKVYVACANNLYNLEHVFTFDEEQKIEDLHREGILNKIIDKEVVERISYINKVVLVVYGLRGLLNNNNEDYDPLISGFAYKIVYKSWKKGLRIGSYCLSGLMCGCVLGWLLHMVKQQAYLNVSH